MNSREFVSPGEEVEMAAVHLANLSRCLLCKCVLRGNELPVRECAPVYVCGCDRVSKGV